MSLNKQRKALINTFLAILLFIAVGFFSEFSNNPETKGIDDTIYLEGIFVVTEVVDGDTIKVTTGNEEVTIRLIGINTPETKDPRKDVECFGLESTNHLKQLIENKPVSLKSDTSQDETDRYGRALRYVFLEDGTNVNLAMIKDGFAYEYTYAKPYYYQEEFIEAEDLARNSGLGLWSENTCAGML